MFLKDWSRFFNEISVLVIGSLIGVQLRMTLQSYLFWLLPAPIFSLSAAQFVGCVVMGTTVGAQSSLSRLHPSMYLLFTTGVAGSTTSFSSWAVELSEMLTEPWNKNESRIDVHRLPIKSDSNQIRQYLHDALTDQTRFQFGDRLMNPYQITQHLQRINMLSRLGAFTINVIITLSLAQAGFLFGLHVGQTFDRLVSMRHRTSNTSIALADQRLQQLRSERGRQKLQNIFSWIFCTTAIALLLWLLLCVALHATGRLSSTESECSSRPETKLLRPNLINEESVPVQAFHPIVIDEADNSSTSSPFPSHSSKVTPKLFFFEIESPDFLKLIDDWIVPSKRMTATLLLAPCGTILRWRMSLLLNNRIDSFICLGTFVVNISASLFAFALHLISVDLGEAPEGLAFHTRHLLPLVWAARDGFCGCLSTVSTFIGELIRLKRSRAYVYGMISVLGIPAVNIAFLCLYTWISPQLI